MVCNSQPICSLEHCFEYWKDCRIRDSGVFKELKFMTNNLKIGNQFYVTEAVLLLSCAIKHVLLHRMFE